MTFVQLPLPLVRTVAALYVMPRGVYVGVPGVDPWDEARDARRYAGPHPVVAHPPCARWSRLAGLVEARWGHRRGEDGGCFAAALDAVRAWGGVLEHPADSKAWRAHGLVHPPRAGGWIAAGDGAGWTCHVEQGHYGHPGRKPTWLYAAGCELPSLRWGRSTATAKIATWYRRDDTGARTCVQRGGDVLIPKAQRSRTPVPFRDVLIAMARSASSVQRAA